MSLLLSQLSGGDTVTVDSGALTLAGQSIVTVDILPIVSGSLTLSASDIGNIEICPITSANLVLAGQGITEVDIVGVGSGSIALSGSNIGNIEICPIVSTDLTIAGQDITDADIVGAPAPSHDGETVLAPGGPGLSRKKWRELLALLEAEKAARREKDELPILVEVASAVDRVAGVAQATGILPSVKAATRTINLAVVEHSHQRAMLALKQLRAVEAEMYRRAREEQEMEELIMMGVL